MATERNTVVPITPTGAVVPVATVTVTKLVDSCTSENGTPSTQSPKFSASPSYSSAAQTSVSPATSSSVLVTPLETVPTEPDTSAAVITTSVTSKYGPVNTFQTDSSATTTYNTPSDLSNSYSPFSSSTSSPTTPIYPLSTASISPDSSTRLYTTTAAASCTMNASSQRVCMISTLSTSVAVIIVPATSITTVIYTKTVNRIGERRDVFTSTESSYLSAPTTRSRGHLHITIRPEVAAKASLELDSSVELTQDLIVNRSHGPITAYVLIAGLLFVLVFALLIERRIRKVLDNVVKGQAKESSRASRL